jgi:hypothetical protein
MSKSGPSVDQVNQQDRPNRHNGETNERHRDGRDMVRGEM